MEFDNDLVCLKCGGLDFHIGIGFVYKQGDEVTIIEEVAIFTCEGCGYFYAPTEKELKEIEEAYD